MSSTTFVRWSGLLLLLGGLLSGAALAFHPLSPDLNVMLGSRWIIVHNLAGISLLLIVPGLAGLYHHLSRRGGELALVSFILMSIAAALMGGLLLFIESVILPVAASNPAFIALADPASDVYHGTAVILVFLGTCLFFAVGSVLLGITIVRDGELPRIAGYLVIVGGLLGALPTPPAPTLIVVVGAVLFGLGMIGVGYTLWRRPGSIATAAPVAMGA